MAKLSDIKPENQHLLEQDEDVVIILQKLYDWQEEYDYIPWTEFRDWWHKCSRCEGYSIDQCICYAR